MEKPNHSSPSPNHAHVANGSHPSAPSAAPSRGGGSYMWVYPVAFILALAVFGGGVYLAAARGIWNLFAAGCACVLAVLVTWPIASILCANRQANSKLLESLWTLLDRQLTEFSGSLTMLNENQLLSDRAKAIAFRSNDREALRRAIHEELSSQEFDAARTLADEIERAFGSKAEADTFRREIDQKRNELFREKVAEHVAIIDRLTRSEKWQDAHREAERLGRAFPNDEQVRNLPTEIETRRKQHKDQLIASLHEAVARKDADGGIELVKRLDLYLSPAEAEKLQDEVRALFKQKLENLRTQFSLAAQDKNDAEKYRVAREIVDNFPNTQMARELRELLPVLREAAETGAAQPETAGA